MLARLVDKSLVAVAEGPTGRTRYRLLDTVHEYAHWLLVEAGELEAARERHLRHFAQFADTGGAGWFRDAERLVGELEDDYENVRGALEWAADSDPCAARSLLAGMSDLFHLFGQADGRRLAQLLLGRCPLYDRARAEVQLTAGSLALMVADIQAAGSALAQASELSVELGERTLEGWARFFQGLSGALAGVGEPAREHLEASRAIFEAEEILEGWAVATAALGVTYLNADQPTRARELVDEGLAVNIATDYAWGQGQCHIYLGMIAEATGTDPARAAFHYQRAAEQLRPLRGGPLLPVALVGQAGVLARRDPEKALRVAAAGYALRERVGGQFAPFFRALAERARAAAEAPLGADAPRTWKEGARLSLDEAIALAFGTAEPTREPPAGLSEREAEVANLVADGLSNKAIASRLHLSVRTVEHHVRHALAKARLENRTQLATWARERIR
jgi:non-specific serine/threonine protein kinase